MMEEQNEITQNENRMLGPSVADLERRVKTLERRLAVIEARLSEQVPTTHVDEGEDVEQRLDEGVAEETVRVHDVGNP